MRHRQISGAGPLGTRTGITIAVLVVVGLVCTVTVGQPAGVWIGYFLSAGGAVLGFSGLWWRRGMLERQVKEMAKRRRADLARIAVAEQRHQAEADRLRTELEHEQQYSALVKDQLQRARRQLDEQRTARLTAEREIDALAAWLSEGGPSGPAGLMAVNPLLEAELPDDPMHGGAIHDDPVRSDPISSGSAPLSSDPINGDPAHGDTTPADGEADRADPEQSAQLSGRGEAPAHSQPVTPLAEPMPRPDKAGGTVVVNPAPGIYVSLPAEAAAAHRQKQKQSRQRERPAILDRAAAAAAARQTAEENQAQARAYRPFLDHHLAGEAVPESALAMAPVIDPGGSDSVLDLTAYDETVEFTVREIRHRPA